MIVMGVLVYFIECSRYSVIEGVDGDTPKHRTSETRPTHPRRTRVSRGACSPVRGSRATPPSFGPTKGVNFFVTQYLPGPRSLPSHFSVALQGVAFNDVHPY